MAFGLAPLSQSFKADMRMIGGIVTGSSGEFLALPISSTVLQGLSGLTTNEWSRFYLSDSFGAASASVIQALNYLSASMDATSGDVSGPASSTDNAVVRFNGATGKSIQNSTLVTFTDAGAFTGGAGGASYTLAANGQISGTNAVVAGTTVSGAGDVSGKSLTTEESTISVAGVVSGAGAGQFGTLATEEATISVAGVVSGAGTATFGGVSSRTALATTIVSGASLGIGSANDNGLTVTVAGLVAGGAGLDSYGITAAGLFSGSAVTAGTDISASGLVSANALTTEEAAISVAGVISGAGTITAGGISVGNGAGQITAGGGGVFGGTLQAAALTAGGITAAIDGFISGTVSAGIVATNTGSVNNANQKVAFAISSSDISTAANAALIPRMVMQGTNEAGALASYMVTITGGLLQTIELSYGTALPV